MTYEEFNKQAYLAALTGLLAARGNDAVFDNGADKDNDGYFKVLDSLHGIAEIAEQMAYIAMDHVDFDE